MLTPLFEWRNVYYAHVSHAFSLVRDGNVVDFKKDADGKAIALCGRSYVPLSSWHTQSNVRERCPVCAEKERHYNKLFWSMPGYRGQ